MFKKSTTAALALGSVLSASAQSMAPGLDASSATFNYAGEMDFDGSAGSLSVSSFDIRTLLCKPLSPMTGLTILPSFEYKATGLDFNGVSPGYPIGDEDLHSLSLSAVALSMRDGCPWIYGAWARAELASDFQDISGDDFTFDLAAGAGYRFNEKFTLTFGGAVMNLNGDTQFYPGIGFDWVVNDQVRVGLYGPTFIASYTPDENWMFSVRGDASGGIWNISDTGGASRSIDLSSYDLGVFVNRRLTGELWLSAGAGATLGNEIRLTEPNGDKLFKQDLNSGLFAQVSLRLKSW